MAAFFQVGHGGRPRAAKHDQRFCAEGVTSRHVSSFRLRRNGRTADEIPDASSVLCTHGWRSRYARQRVPSTPLVHSGRVEDSQGALPLESGSIRASGSAT